MSEFQYYEFLAIEKPLSEDDIDDLRSISSRAYITATSFTNVYNWSDLKGDPEELMKRYFDVHIYVANWGTAIFMVRVPTSAIPQEILETVANECFFYTYTNSHVILTWHLDEAEDDERFAIEDGDGWMVRLAAIREELLHGDFRSLYIGWLMAVEYGLIDENGKEPFCVSSMGKITNAQRALAEFLEVNIDLVVGALQDSNMSLDDNVFQQDMSKWLDEHSMEEVRPVLKQLLSGENANAERTIRSLFTSWQRQLTEQAQSSSLRTIREIMNYSPNLKRSDESINSLVLSINDSGSMEEFQGNEEKTSFDYEDYEKECRKIRAENENLLADFLVWLRGKGLSEKTVQKHYENVYFYVDQYLLYEDATPAAEGVNFANDFLGYWFIRKAMWASEASIRANATSMKKFYTFMLEDQQLIEKDELDELKNDIKEMMPEWIATLKRFDDPNIEDPEEIWGF